MIVTLESTDRLVTIERPGGGTVPARVWVGRTAQGIACHAYITRIAVARDLDAAEFERDLQEQHAPLDPALSAAIPARLVL